MVFHNRVGMVIGRDVRLGSKVVQDGRRASEPRLGEIEVCDSMHVNRL